jgi:hypothetical protein
MVRKKLRAHVAFLCLMVILMHGSLLYPAQSGDGPVIHFDETRHVFPTVFEGAELTRTFVVSNRGTAPLNIKKVTHS